MNSTADPCKPTSLRLRLLAVAVLVLLVSLGAVGIAINAANQRSVEAALQARMESYFYLVLAAMEMDSDGHWEVAGELVDPVLLTPGSGWYAQVIGDTGQWSSESALGLSLPPARFAPTGALQFENPVDSKGYYVYRRGVGWELPGGMIEPFAVSILVSKQEVQLQLDAFQEGLWTWIGLAALLLACSQIVLIVYAFRPLNRIAKDVASIESGRTPRLEGVYPREVEPLARNVNRLLDAEQSSRERIRNALDSLAHSLKTPLAVIQAALPKVEGDVASTLQKSVDDMSALIATRLERASGSARRTLAEPVQVEPLAQRILESLHKVHSHKLIQAQCTLEPGLAFYGEQRDVMELLGNLLDNAFKYGKSRVQINGGVEDPEQSRPGLWLRVDDDGAGIDKSQWERLLKRGVRGDEREEGHGLGLAIVLELVSAYGGEMTINDSALGGASVTIRIPSS